MPLRKTQSAMLDLMIQQELKVAELYQLFADRVPELKDFWLEMRGEELMHAQWIEHLARKTEEGEVLFPEFQVRQGMLEAFIKFIESAIRKVSASQPTIVEALNIAAGIEDSMLERKLFDHFEDNSMLFAGLLAKLRRETETHHTKIRDLLKRTRERSASSLPPKQR